MKIKDTTKGNYFISGEDLEEALGCGGVVCRCRRNDVRVGLLGKLAERGLDLQEGAGLRDPKHLVRAFATGELAGASRVSGALEPHLADAAAAGDGGDRFRMDRAKPAKTSRSERHGSPRGTLGVKKEN